MEYEEKYMRLAIDLARRGEGAVNPNPLVGAVIVKDGKIIGQGYHTAYGNLHAEREAIKSLTESAEGADIYVTLEPCCHYGKQPPCVEAIVEQGIKRVFVGSDDPNALVSGKGYKYLREHGIEVHTHILKDECDALNDIFFHYITTGLPYVVMKYAMTLDGKIAAYTGLSKWISNETSRHDSQKLRNRLSGIMVGIGTVLKDDPMLTCRLEDGHNPTRIICDTHMRIPLDSHIVKTAQEVPTILAVGKSMEDESSHAEIETETKKSELTSRGVELLYVDEQDGHIDLGKLIKALGDKKIDSIILEGGGELNYAALSAGIVDEIIIYLAPKLLGGVTAPTPVGGTGLTEPSLSPHFKLAETTVLDGDIKLRYIKDSK